MPERVGRGELFTYISLDLLRKEYPVLALTLCEECLLASTEGISTKHIWSKEVPIPWAATVNVLGAEIAELNPSLQRRNSNSEGEDDHVASLSQAHTSGTWG